MGLSENKTIMIFSAYYPPHVGGVERYAAQLSKSLIKKGHKVIVVTSAINGQAGKEESSGIIIYRLPSWDLIQNRYPLPVPFKSRKLLKEIEKINVDYYIANMRIYPLTLIGGNIAARNKKPFILIDHATGHFSVNNRFLDKIGEAYEHVFTKFTDRHVTAYYGVSRAVSVWLAHFGLKSSGEIYNGVDGEIEAGGDADTFQKDGLPDDAFIFVYAGRLIEDKGIKILTAAFCKISERHPRARLYIVGEGKLLSELKSAYHKQKKIIITGQAGHNFVMNLLQRADCVVLPSYYPEGLPTIILEAGLMKCAVIATPKGGVTEVIENDRTGLIVEPKSETALYQAMELLINNDALSSELANDLHNKIISGFTWDKITTGLIRELETYG